MKRDFKELLPKAEQMSAAEIRAMWRDDTPPPKHPLLDQLIAEFNGAIKYAPMLQDHPEWDREQCLEFARAWHAVAVNRLKVSALDAQGIFRTPDGLPWNERIPYCRNVPSAAVLAEAGKG